MSIRTSGRAAWPHGVLRRLTGWSTRTIAKMIGFAQLASTRESAKALQSAMTREDGVGTAVRALEAMLACRR